MKRMLLMVMAALMIGCTSNGQVRVGQRNGGPRGGRGGMVDKSKDSVLTALKAETLGKFQQFTYQDVTTGKQMVYSLCFPKDYDETQRYPMIMFIGDASTVGDPQRPLTQGYGALEFASDRDQEAHPSFVLVPSYTGVCVDDNFNTSDEVEMTIRLINHLCKQYPIDTNRLYTTGQSMGGMMSFYFNIAHPDLFAASLFVGSQWDTSKMAHFAKKRFFYIVGGGDEKASKGMTDLVKVLKENNAQMDSASWSAKLPQDEQEQRVKAMIQSGNPIHFLSFTPGSVLSEEGKGMEHMESFDYAYKLQAVRDWLFEQIGERPEPEHSPNVFLVMYDAEIGKEPLLKAINDYKVEIIYDYRMMDGMALRKPDGKTLEETMAFFKAVKGVLAVEYDHVYHLTDPVKPKLEIK